jgi:hypothetical protein
MGINSAARTVSFGRINSARRNLRSTLDKISGYRSKCQHPEFSDSLFGKEVVISFEQMSLLLSVSYKVIQRRE